ncbi:MAG: hypothetical protein IPK74_10300 [Deltaproteobacteria bacterium]|nr:hypothetical protein [Deltaproteobacteria bacterium]
MPMPRVRTTLGLTLALTLVGATGTALAKPRRAAELGAQLVDTLQRELGFTRSSTEIHRGLEALDREQTSLQYTAALLDHASGESMRRLSAYAEGNDDRERRMRARGRALYKLARGGAARLAFGERFGEEDEGATAARLSRAHTACASWFATISRSWPRIAAHASARAPSCSRLRASCRHCRPSAASTPCRARCSGAPAPASIRPWPGWSARASSRCAARPAPRVRPTASSSRW